MDSCRDAIREYQKHTSKAKSLRAKQDQQHWTNLIPSKEAFRNEFRVYLVTNIEQLGALVFLFCKREIT